MSTQFVLNRDLTGIPAYSPPFAEDKYSVTLVANTEATVTIPSNYNVWEVIFSYEPGGAVWVSNSGTAEVPAGNSLLPTTSELNPASRFVESGNILSFITNNSSCEVGVALYAYS